MSEKVRQEATWNEVTKLFNQAEYGDPVMFALPCSRCGHYPSMGISYRYWEGDEEMPRTEDDCSLPGIRSFGEYRSCEECPEEWPGRTAPNQIPKGATDTLKGVGLKIGTRDEGYRISATDEMTVEEKEDEKDFIEKRLEKAGLRVGVEAS